MKSYKLKLSEVDENQGAIGELCVGEGVAVYGDAGDALRWVIRDSRDRDLGELPRKGAYLDLIADGWDMTGAVVHALFDPTDDRPAIDVTIKVTLEDLRETRALREKAEQMLEGFRQEDELAKLRAAEQPPVSSGLSPTSRPKGFWARLFGK